MLQRNDPGSQGHLRRGVEDLHLTKCCNAGDDSGCSP
jgi:hypothetical protein